MTKIIAVVNQKGGPGKTTLSINLGDAFRLAGYRVLLVDADPQGSMRDWNEVNDAEILPVVGLDRQTLPKDLDAIKHGYDIVIVDGAPQIKRLSAAAIKRADLVLIPCQPSPYDVWATADLVDLVKARQDVTGGKPKAAFVISRKIQGTILGREVAQALKDYQIPTLKSCTTQRVAYPTTAAEGQTVFAEPESPAAKEITNIMRDVLELLDET